jgi:hypothetical protein
MKPIPPHVLHPFAEPGEYIGIRRKPRLKLDRGYWMCGFPGTDRIYWSTGRSILEAWKNFRPSHFAV